MIPIHILSLDTMMELINRQDNNNSVVIYEFHRYVSDEYYTSSFEEFKKRSKDFYKTYILTNGQIDDWPAKIDHAFKINGEWYLCFEGSSNFYLGGGPTSLLRLRQLCTEKRITIIYCDIDIIQFAYGRFQNYDLPVYYNYPPYFKNRLKEVLTKANQSKTRPDTKKKNPFFEDEQIYESEFVFINKAIDFAKTSFEDTAKDRENKDENSLRNEFLPIINAYLRKHTGSAEAQRGKGRTDILIKSKNFKRNFVYECKVAITKESFQKAIEKLLTEYLSPQDRHAGIIFFNKSNNYSFLIKKIPTYIKETKGELLTKLSVLEKYFPQEFKCSYQRPNDKRSFVEIVIFTINIASNVKPYKKRKLEL